MNAPTRRSSSVLAALAALPLVACLVACQTAHDGRQAPPAAKVPTAAILPIKPTPAGPAAPTLSGNPAKELFDALAGAPSETKANSSDVKTKSATITCSWSANSTKSSADAVTYDCLGLAPVSAKGVFAFLTAPTVTKTNAGHAATSKTGAVSCKLTTPMGPGGSSGSAQSDGVGTSGPTAAFCWACQFAATYSCINAASPPR